MPNPGVGAEHVVSFYLDDACIVDQMTAFIRDGLAAGEQVIALATLPHWNAVADRLAQTGVDHAGATAEGSLVVLDAEDVYERIRVDGEISVDRFMAIVTPLLASGRKQRVYGEVVSLLTERGEIEAALAIEALGHQFSEQGIEILCGYQIHPALTPLIVRRVEGMHDRSVFESAGKRPARLRPEP